MLEKDLGPKRPLFFFCFQVGLDIHYPFAIHPFTSFKVFDMSAMALIYQRRMDKGGYYPWEGTGKLSHPHNHDFLRNKYIQSNQVFTRDITSVGKMIVLIEGDAGNTFTEYVQYDDGSAFFKEPYNYVYQKTQGKRIEIREVNGVQRLEWK